MVLARKGLRTISLSEPFSEVFPLFSTGPVPREGGDSQSVHGPVRVWRDRYHNRESPDAGLDNH